MSFFDLVEDADRAAQANLGGEPVTYAPAVGAPVSTTPSGDPLLGLFDPGGVNAQGDARVGVEVTKPKVFLLLADLPTDPRNDTPLLTIRGVRYHVEGRSPDGAGGISLDLRTVG